MFRTPRIQIACFCVWLLTHIIFYLFECHIVSRKCHFELLVDPLGVTIGISYLLSTMSGTLSRINGRTMDITEAISFICIALRMVYKEKSRNNIWKWYMKYAGGVVSKTWRRFWLSGSFWSYFKYILNFKFSIFKTIPISIYISVRLKPIVAQKKLLTYTFTNYYNNN